MRAGKLIVVWASLAVICMTNACGSSDKSQPVVTGTVPAVTGTVTETQAKPKLTGSGTETKIRADVDESETEKDTEENERTFIDDYLINAEAGSKSTAWPSYNSQGNYDSYRRLHPMNNDLISLDILNVFNEEVSAFIGAPSYKYDAFNGVMEVPDNYLDGDFPAWTALVADWAYYKTRSEWSYDMQQAVYAGYKYYGDNLTALYGDGSSERDQFVSLYVTYYTIKEKAEKKRTNKEKEIYFGIQSLITKVHDIIRSQNGINKTAVSNSGSTGSAYSSADPLKGLVADDILTPFRKDNWFNPQIAHDTQSEAMMLGQWVQYKIKSPTSEMLVLSTNIGNRYEWLFGTDVSNCYQNNFPYYYAYYFALKDFYNSNGTKSYDTYSRICSDYYFFNSGNPDVEINKLYSDLQKFITASNNVIRAKL